MAIASADARHRGSHPRKPGPLLRPSARTAQLTCNNLLPTVTP